MSTMLRPTNLMNPAPKEPDRFISLRSKFVGFFSLILILACSGLSFYFIESRRAAMIEGLYRLGTILLTSVVNNGQFRYGGLVAEDPATLRQFTQSLLAVEDVVYVVIRGADGAILAQDNKLTGPATESASTATERRFYPDESIARSLYGAPIAQPRLTPVVMSKDNILIPVEQTGEWLWFKFRLSNNLYDFALPVIRKPVASPAIPSLSLELEEKGQKKTPADAPLVQGVVQIGISDAQVKQILIEMIRNVAILTLLIITAGILGAHFLTLRITTPIRKLADIAKQVAEGGTPPPLEPTTEDEIGQLTHMFNVMTQSLHERGVAITTNLETIRRQVNQLTTVHQTSAAITRTLDLDQLLDTILQLLTRNLGLSRMLLMLRRDDSHTAYVAQVAGVPEEIATAARHMKFPFRDDDSLMAELFFRAKPVLVRDIEGVTHRMQPAMLELARRVGVRSFVCAPLQSHDEILGFLAGDRGDQPSTAEDMEILTTIAAHVATAIDNAKAYGRLAKLTETLEQRIEDRTRELSAANERLQEHDRRRTMFVSVASHELRTPMTVIRSFADNMLDGVAGTLTDRQKVYLTRIGHNLNRLTRIINQLLDWSRLDLKKEELHTEPLCIGTITGVVLESLRMVADEKHVSLSLQAPKELPQIMGDRDKLEQILWNLIGNALKFTPQGGSVTTTLEALPDHTVQICVADTGCGIPRDHLHKVFDEFSKVPSSVPGSQGAQLGLFITKTFVTMHKGRIWVESTEGVGTKFFFTLPCASGGPPCDTSKESDGKPSTPPGSAS